MREFFQGWRRKAGCVTLLVSLALFGMWMRSRVMVDGIDYVIGRCQYSVMSADGRIVWRSSDKDSHSAFRIYSVELERVSYHGIDQFFDVTRINIKNPSQWESRYGSLVIAITLLSAYLILWKPQKPVIQSNEIRSSECL